MEDRYVPQLYLTELTQLKEAGHITQKEEALLLL